MRTIIYNDIRGKMRRRTCRTSSMIYYTLADLNTPNNIVRGPISSRVSPRMRVYAIYILYTHAGTVRVTAQVIG